MGLGWGVYLGLWRNFLFGLSNDRVIVIESCFRLGETIVLSRVFWESRCVWEVIFFSCRSGLECFFLTFGDSGREYIGRLAV